MAKVTSKLQVTVPKAIADRFGIRPGDDIEWRAEGNGIRVLPRVGEDGSLDREARIRSFDEATARQEPRNRAGRRAGRAGRGWTREELCDQFVVLLPDELLLRTALRGAAAYQLAWFDAHMWAYAERNGIPEILSEDFQHGRRYGSVRAVNPFLDR